MFRFLRKRATFKAVPQPTLRYCNYMSLRWFHGGQGTVGAAGVNESLAFLVNSFATERRELLDRLEKASKDH
jgi:hypothetical protein